MSEPRTTPTKPRDPIEPARGDDDASRDDVIHAARREREAARIIQALLDVYWEVNASYDLGECQATMDAAAYLASRPAPERQGG